MMAKMNTALGFSSSHRVQRLNSLEEGVLRSVVDDQVFFVEGIITVYRSLVNPEKLIELEQQQRRLGWQVALSAPHVTGMTPQKSIREWNHHDHLHNKEQQQQRCAHHDELGVLQALQMLKEVDTAISWCEGKMAIAAHLFPPVMMKKKSNSNNQHQLHGAVILRGSSESNAWGSPDHPETPAPLHPSSSQLEQRKAVQNCVESLNGYVPSRSRGRHRVWLGDTPISLSSNTTGEDEEMGESARCHLDFDRWTARLVSSQAQQDKRRLWVLRCVAEEAVSRHASLVEERIGRITLLVSAREQLAVGAEPLIRLHMRKDPQHVWEMKLRGAEERVQRWLHAQDELLESALCYLQKGVELFGETCQQQLQEANCRRRRYKEKGVENRVEATDSPCRGKEIQTILSGSRVTGAVSSDFTHALLCESEKTQRLHIDTEARLSWQLLTAHWQSILNHSNTRRLIAAKERLIHNLSSDLGERSPTRPSLRGASGWLPGGVKTNANEQQRQSTSGSHTPLSIDEGSNEGVGCSRRAGLHSAYATRALRSAQACKMSITPLLNSPRADSFTRFATRVAGNSTSSTTNTSTILSVANTLPGYDKVHDALYEACRPTSPQPSSLSTSSDSRFLQLLLNARRMGGGGSYDTTLYICTSVELVKRKQILLMEQYSRIELTERADNEIERCVRCRKRPTS